MLADSRSWNWHLHVFKEPFELCKGNRHKAQIRFSIWCETLPRPQASQEATHLPLLCAWEKCRNQSFQSNEEYFRHVDSCQEFVNGTYMCPKCGVPETLPLLPCKRLLLWKKLTNCVNILGELSGKLRDDQMLNIEEPRRMTGDSMGHPDSIYGNFEACKDAESNAEYLQGVPSLWQPGYARPQPRELAASTGFMPELHEEPKTAGLEKEGSNSSAGRRTLAPLNQDSPNSHTWQGSKFPAPEDGNADHTTIRQPYLQDLQTSGMPATQPLTYVEAYCTSLYGQSQGARHNTAGLNGRCFSHVEPDIFSAQPRLPASRRHSELPDTRRLVGNSIGPSLREYKERMSRLEPIITSHPARRSTTHASHCEPETQSSQREPRNSVTGSVSALSSHPTSSITRGKFVCLGLFVVCQGLMISAGPH